MLEAQRLQHVVVEDAVSRGLDQRASRCLESRFRGCCQRVRDVRALDVSRVCTIVVLDGLGVGEAYEHVCSPPDYHGDSDDAVVRRGVGEDRHVASVCLDVRFFVRHVLHRFVGGEHGGRDWRGDVGFSS